MRARVSQRAAPVVMTKATVIIRITAEWTFVRILQTLWGLPQPYPFAKRGESSVGLIS